MSGTAEPGTAEAGVESAGAAAPEGNATQQASGEGKPAVTPPAESQPDIYDAAFDDFMGPNAKDPSEAPSSENLPNPPKDPPPGELPASEAQKPTEKQVGGTADQPPQLSEDQIKVLSRQHLTPEMVKGWSKEQLDNVLTNTVQRETDQNNSYQTMAKKLDDLTKRVDQGGTTQDPKASGEGEGGKGNPLPAVASDAQKVADQLVTDFGPEMKSAGTMLVNMAKQLDDANKLLNSTGGRFDSSEASTKTQGQMIVDLTLENAIIGLVGEYPSLAKDEVREQVIGAFEAEWKSEASRFRAGKGTVLSRVKKGIAAAAKSELSSSTEAAAQVQLVNKTKERLKNQPTPGQGKERSKPKTDDEIMDQAFAETIGKELR